jgi:diadenosine tetraphosphatase ApaH/serine/threonine PP2A family protein phosphatase
MPSRFFNVIENYSEKDILTLIKDIDKVFDSENNLVYIPKSKIMVVGDLHGDLETLQKIIQLFFRDNFDRLLFLGDYVDRGAKQVEVVNVLLYYKKILPDKMVLLRGNHEDPIINRHYGFYDQVRLKFSNYKHLYRSYNRLFSKLPLAALTWNRIFCLHGGVPQDLESIKAINNLPKEEKNINHPITKQLLWNDPHKRVKEFKWSSRGPGIKRFGKQAFDEFINENEIKHIIRSHEKCKNGYKKYFNDKLITIFSSRSYSKRISTVVGVIDREGEFTVQDI